MNIIFVLKTYGLNFDERVNKEAITLSQAGNNIEIFALELDNRSKADITKYGIPYRTISLWSRSFFPRGKFLWIKIIEMYLRFVILLLTKKWDVLWVHDHSCAGILLYGKIYKLFLRGKRIIWDQHELGPERVLNRGFYHWLLDQCDAVIHANVERALYLKNKVPQRLHERFFTIKNFPNQAFIDEPAKPHPEEFAHWLNNSPYCLFQGGALTYRMVLECIEAIYKFEKMKLLIMGPCDENTLALIEDRFPSYKEKVYITGWIDPGSFLKYIDGAQVSLVFYENIDQNHWLCAPNRFYHAILRGVPVVCGSNPTMRKIVETNHIGKVCKSNGADPDEISQAIYTIINNIIPFRKKCKIVQKQFVWEMQEHIFEEILHLAQK